MLTVEGYADRLSAAARTAIRSPDGAVWYNAREMCQALQLPDRCAYRSVRREHKWPRYEYHAGWRSTVRLYIAREGVEALILKKGGLPRASLLAALDAATPPRR